MIVVLQYHVLLDMIVKMVDVLKENHNVIREVFVQEVIAYHQPVNHVQEELNVWLDQPALEDSNVLTINAH
jgi:hypothetical protein